MIPGPKPAPSLFRFAAAALAGLLLAGCSELPRRDPAKTGPFFSPTNVSSSAARLPADLRRVLVLPAAGNPAIDEDTLTRIDEALQTELGRTGRFELVPLTRDMLAKVVGTRQLNSAEQLPATFLDKLFNIYNAYRADAVLFVDVTHFSAYPPLQLGLRVKLARIRDGEIVWAADNVFSADNPAVVNSARAYSLSLGNGRRKIDLSHTVLQNPSRFAGYAAAATFSTLPPR